MKTFTYSDIDLNFLPTQSSQERILGNGEIVANINSNKIFGQETFFTYNLIPNDNIYINGIFLGKVFSIESDTALTLYKAAVNITGVTENLILTDLSTNINALDFPWQGDISWDISDWDLERDVLNYSIINTDGSTGLISTELYPIVYDQVSTPWLNSPWLNSTWMSDNVIYKFNLYGTNIPDGTIVPYTTSGIQYPDFLSTNPSNLSYGGITGNVMFENNATYVEYIYTLPETLIGGDNLPDIQIYLHSLINTIPFKYSTPSDVSLIYDVNSIKSSVRNLIQTMNYERKFNSAVGSQVNAIMFELVSPNIKNILTRTITDVIQSYEPRARVQDVGVSVMNEYVNITIIFNVVNTSTFITINMVLERTR